MWLKSTFCNNTRQFRNFFAADAISKIQHWSFNKKYSKSIMQIDTLEFKNVITEEVTILQKLFEDNGYELRIAGGAVRDLLVGITPKDLDFATTATPEQMKEMFTRNNIRMINMTGEKHGTITARINDKDNFEVTTLRIDVVTDGRRAEVEFTKDWQLDANRRDLTINSMFLGLDGHVFDFFNGYEDIKNRRVVFVGDPSQRIQEDYLRILRYFRFFGRISATSDAHDQNTLDAIKSNAPNLSRISGERIWQELHKTIEGRFGYELLKLMVNLGIGPYIGLPDPCNIQRYIELCNRLNDTNQSVRAITLLCGLLDTKEEFWTFHQRCKLSGFDRDLGLFIIQHREEKLHRDPLKPYQLILISTKFKPADVRQYIQEVLKYRGNVELLDKFLSWEVPKFPINGNMIRDRVKTTSGKQVGQLLQLLKEEWCEKDFQPTVEELLALLPEKTGETNENKRLKTS